MKQIMNYINNEWIDPKASEFVEVINPATGEIIAKTPLCGETEVDITATAAAEAFPSWRQTPVQDRIQYLFKLRDLLKENHDEISRVITEECGKTFDESKAEMVRAIENVEVACGMPMMMKGDISEDVSPGIDEIMLRQPLGVCATIAPFNFPGMVSFWYLPYALATGNTYIIKPSEKVSLTMRFIFSLIEQVGFPRGVVNMVNGAKNAVDAILDHPEIRAITFVGSTQTAKYIYRRAAENGKRVQAQGGAKNPVIILPDADMEMATAVVADSAFGCAGQRCLAVSLAITVADARNSFTELICDAASTRTVGYGLDDGVQMGPVINNRSKERVEQLIGVGSKEGASALVDGRGTTIKGYEGGAFIRPTILADVHPGSDIWKTEIFGPVLSVVRVKNYEEALSLVNEHELGNGASIYTSDGEISRHFTTHSKIGMVGVNVPIPVPMAFHSFGGWKRSLFGDHAMHGMDGIRFFTRLKTITSR